MNDTPLEPDTCRICRGEATVFEPLFHPCKCSGSIKYVHQDCLKKWLSRSRKKHCELCKIPFRFTRLYAADTSRPLSINVYVSHMAKRIFRNFLVVARALLVFLVWLCWLPYLMSSVWRYLFRIGDEDLNSGQGVISSQINANPSNTSVLSTILPKASPLSALSATTTTEAVLHAAQHTLCGVVPLILDSRINSSTEDGASVVYTDSPTLLSDTRSFHVSGPGVFNLTLKAILEGQIITALVLACLILIIRVRDFVVQQQSEINARPTWAAADNQLLPQHLMRSPVSLCADDIDNLQGLGDLDRENIEARDTAVVLDNVLESSSSIASQRNDGGTLSTRSSQLPRLVIEPSSQRFSSSPSLQFTELRGQATRDNIRARVCVAESSTAHEYFRVHREQGGDLEKLLQTTRNANLKHELAYRIRLTQSTVENCRPADSSAEIDSCTSTRVWRLGSLRVPSGLVVSVSPRSGTLRNSIRICRRDRSEGVWSLDSGSAGKGKATEVIEKISIVDVQPRQFARPHYCTEYTPESEIVGPPEIGDRPSFNRPKELDGSSKPTDSFLGGLSQGLLVDEFGGSGSHPWECLSPASGTPVESCPSDFRDQRSQILKPYQHRDLGDQIVASMMRDSTDIRPQIQEAQSTTEQENVPNLSDLEAVRQPTRDVTHAKSQKYGSSQRLEGFVWQDIDANETNEALLGTDGATNLPDNNGSFEDAQGEDATPEAGERVREVIEAAAASGFDAGLDTEAMESAEGPSHIMGMIGMRGPVPELFQNAIHCAFLVSVSIFVGIFLPYSIGSTVIRVVVDPIRPSKLLFSIHKSVQCVAPAITAAFSSALGSSLSLLRWVIVSDTTESAIGVLFNTSLYTALPKKGSFSFDVPPTFAGKFRHFSAVSRRVLLTIKWHIKLVYACVVNTMIYLFGDDPIVYIAGPRSSAVALALATRDLLKELITRVSCAIHSDRPETITAINPNYPYRTALDRVWAILVGYLCIISIAGLYLLRRGLFTRGQVEQEWEISVIRRLNQGSSVMKVILITGIEMLIFPLYCGVLLDIALLPALEDTSVHSRILFTTSSPLTSIFVHWFVGIGYMFCFSRFVAMCRKAMRDGILCFIRDPDDPEFHPIRDILESSSVTQLRKIFFSAFVYGVLIIICFGGVVWGLSFSIPSILPIRYSFDEPVPVFLVHLLFHNSLAMLLSIKLLKPSLRLHAVYTWWGRRCARALRISWFLLGERQIDEEGTLVLAPDSPHRATARWRRQFLGLTDEGDIIPKAWRDTFKGEGSITSTMAPDDMIRLDVKKAILVQSQQLVPNGHFVCYPVADKIKVAESMYVLEVSENKLCSDGKFDHVETDMFSTDRFHFVYIPPNLRIRVTLFIFFVWIFSAAGGIGFTVIPLVFGRQIFHLLFPSHTRINDIHAFSIGMYVLVSLVYSVVYIRSLPKSVRTWTRPALSVMLHRDSIRHVAKLTYLYVFLLIILPVMASSLMENYLFIPFNAYFWSATTSSIQAQYPSSLGIQGHAIQAWNIGVLGLRLGARIMESCYRDSHLTAAIHTNLQNGLVDPDITYLTQEFMISGLFLWCLALTGPPVLARLFIRCGMTSLPPSSAPPELINIMSFPIVAMLALMGCSLWNLIKIFKRWQATVRDEVHFTEQRLQNFDIGASAYDTRVRNPRAQIFRIPGAFYRLAFRTFPLRTTE